MEHSQRAKRLHKTLIYTFLLICVPAVAVAGAIDVFEFKDESERARYMVLVDELRCPKCQNQNLADSNSQIAIDLRAEVARMVDEGLSDKDVKEYMVNRYGDFVLYEPPVQKNTLVLWWAPVLMVLIGLVVFASIIYQRRNAGEPELASDGQSENNPADDESDNPQKIHPGE